MSISDLNHFMTYVIEGWMLFSAGFIGTTFVSFVSRRIQEDLEAAAVAEGVGPAVIDEATVTQAVEAAVAEGIGQAGDEQFADEEGSDPARLEADEAARLEEVAAVSEQLAKNRGKQSDSSSVSVST